MVELETNKYYKHSGALSPNGIVYICILGSFAAVIFSFIYALATKYISFAYIDILLTLALGGIVGLAISYGAKKGKIRNRIIVIIFAIILGTLAEYLNWVFYIYALSGYKSLIFSPVSLKTIMQFISITGSWSIKNYTPKGTELYLIWLAEGLIIIGTAVYVAFKSMSKSIFCESCNCWAEKKTIVSMLEPLFITKADLKSQLEENDFSSLLQLKKAVPTSRSFTELEITSCDSCMQLFVLNINAIRVDIDSKGKKSLKSTPVIKNVIISPSTYKKIVELDNIALK